MIYLKPNETLDDYFEKQKKDMQSRGTWVQDCPYCPTPLGTTVESGEELIWHGCYLYDRRVSIDMWCRNIHIDWLRFDIVEIINRCGYSAQ